MSIAVSLILVVFFLLMNAFFVIAEFAMVRVRKSQIELAYDEGKRGAKNAKTITENVNAYLSAVSLESRLPRSRLAGWASPQSRRLSARCSFCSACPTLLSR